MRGIKTILPPHVWGDGDPAGVNRRAAEDMKNAARAAQQLGVSVVNGFTGSSIWHLLYSFPPVPDSMIDSGYKQFAERWNPILDVFGECGVRFALEVHPTEIAFDIYSTKRAVEAVGNREEFGFNFDPSHLLWQGVDPVEFIREFPDRIYHCHIKDAIVTLNGRSGILGSHLNFGDPRRGWDFRSPGRGGVNFEEIIRALNQAKYEGPLSVEWEDIGMDREHGAARGVRVCTEARFRAEPRGVRCGICGGLMSKTSHKPQATRLHSPWYNCISLDVDALAMCLWENYGLQAHRIYLRCPAPAWRGIEPSQGGCWNYWTWTLVRLNSSGRGQCGK